MEPDDLTVLPAGPRAAAAARSLVRSRLSALEREDLTDAVVLLTSEVVTNAVIHTSGAARLSITALDAGVRVAVVDDSPVPPVRRRHSAVATTGRGVQLLEDLADEWGWTSRSDGKAVWFSVSGRRDPWSAEPDGDGSAPLRSDGA